MTQWGGQIAVLVLLETILSPARYLSHRFFPFTCSLMAQTSIALDQLTPPDAYPVRPHPNLMSPRRLEVRDPLQGARFRIAQGTFLDMPIITIRNFSPRMAQVLQIYLWPKAERRTFGQGVLVRGKFKTEENSSRLGG